MAAPGDASNRSAKLFGYFKQVTLGKRELKNAADGSRFLEALCSQSNAASMCVESLIASEDGLGALAKSVRFSPTDAAFLAGPGTDVLLFLSDPSIKQLCGGQFLNRTLEAIVEPPSFFNALVTAYESKLLPDNATKAYAWLLLELLSARTEGLPDVRKIAERVTKNESLIKSPSLDVRNLGQKIKHVLQTTSTDDSDGPGGRHDNDFSDFRQIRILPTADEFASQERPFFRRADVVASAPTEKRGAAYLDNQFRLLREDLLGELRNDFQVATGSKRGSKRNFVSPPLKLTGVDCGPDTRRKRCTIKLQCIHDFPQLVGHSTTPARVRFLDQNKNFIKNQSFGCLINDASIVAFGTVERDITLLASSPPVLSLLINDQSGFENALLASKMQGNLRFVQVETPVFAYEPILRCLQRLTDLPLKEQLIDLEPNFINAESSMLPRDILNQIQSMSNANLQSVLGTPRAVELDNAQAESFMAGLRRKVSLIQGPPGTGKSFIGALQAKALHDFTTETILVICFTNHALDQFLEDLLDIGISPNSIVRLGQKWTGRTRCLNISEQTTPYKMTYETFRIVTDLKEQAESYHGLLVHKMASYGNAHITKKLLLEYLEFSEDSDFFDAFVVPEAEDGMQVATRTRRKMNQYYLLDRWASGQDAGVFQKVASARFAAIWDMKKELRQELFFKWNSELIKESATEIGVIFHKYNQCQERLRQVFGQKNAYIIGGKRIIGCTTTAAAKYAEEIQNASPGVIIVEEAGEILESHILTALNRDTKQLILIGDHKQLRPKVNNYALTVEKGDGYNLNQSMFERLVLSGFPHTTLHLQHRMRPEISSLVRKLTYPELEDAPGTQKRPSLRGFQDDVMFINHDAPELNADRIADRRDEGAKSSKENEYEADMVLKCVRYLGQQGYGTDQIVILTPYLGQLFLLKKKLERENDPILSDLDSWDLIRAGLLSPAAGGVTKRPIKLSTIDNYQGEESDIVIASMTRSNSVGEIGFMASPQRVNVLLSRARNALIMIGNAETFMSSRKGKEVWVPLMQQLKADGHIYEGFPVKCERHPNKVALLRLANDFDIKCPDGGCEELCGVKLNCGVHSCPQHCHQLQDHSKMKCMAILHSNCPKNHKMTFQCHESSTNSCRKCKEEAKAEERRRQRDYELDLERNRKQQEYARQIAEIQSEMAHQKRLLQEKRDKAEQDHALHQQRQDLDNLKRRVKEFKISNAKATSSSGAAPVNVPAQPSNSVREDNTNPPEDATQPTAQSPGQTGPHEWENSKAKDDWEYQKQYEGCKNEAMDSLMKMIGLESVKEEFLNIKAKIDVTVRQGISLQDERFGAAFLGNPGTGKTTVARLYAKFLSSVGALPGSHFLETSGAGLADDGVGKCKQHIQNILAAGGGCFFIDEAYQLVSGNSPGGKAVLDYLLAEMENLTGKIVFVLAGYNKQMEAFFAHNPGIPSRVPKQLKFEDYEDDELRRILEYEIVKKYNGTMRVEDGFGGLYLRIVARRLGRGRGRDGFGNAREVQNKFAYITGRQAKRLKKERRRKLNPNDLLLTKEDLIGPEPKTALANNPTWIKLKRMIGLKAVKESIQVLLDTIQYNYQRELEEKPIIQYSLNRCFVGSPGTGKTTVAKYYGRILADIGLLSNGEVVVKNPADFISNVIGGSEANTKAILASTLGKVLVIDEAYMLSTGSDRGSNSGAFKASVIDTLVAEVQSVPGEDRCVLLLGYRDQMEEMFRDVNPGLSRRFPLDSAFNFEDFTDAELRQILDVKLKDQGFEGTDQAKNVAMDMLGRARNRPHFGNAGEVDILLDKAKALHQKHRSSGKSKYPGKFEAHDFDPEFDRLARADTNVDLLFRGVIGCESIVEQLKGYQRVAANMKKIELDPREQIPFTFLFKGPPGTGKTTTARKMGKIFYDMGFLANAQVVECSATDLIGEYIGHTGPKVQKLMEKSLGKVLFVDEAYRLGEGRFAVEAMDEIVDCLTKPKFSRKMIVILAGYDKDIDRLMSTNPGLSSRFPETIIFRPLTAEECRDLLATSLSQKCSQSKASLDLSALTSPSTQLQHQVIQLFRNLINSGSWGNARDVKTLETAIFNDLISSTHLALTEEMVTRALQKMLDERSRRNDAASSFRHEHKRGSRPVADPLSKDTSSTPGSTGTSSNTSDPTHREPPTPKEKPTERPKDNSLDADSDSRDAGVSDEVWHRLRLDKQAALRREVEHQRDLKCIQDEEIARKEALRKAERELQAVLKAQQTSAAANEEARKSLEAERIARELERRRREQELREIERKRMEKEKERQKEIQAQKKLSELGVCVQGFRWIKQAGGYRCAGGAHWVSDGQLGLGN